MLASSLPTYGRTTPSPDLRHIREANTLHALVLRSSTRRTQRECILGMRKTLGSQQEGLQSPHLQETSGIYGQGLQGLISMLQLVSRAPPPVTKVGIWRNCEL